VADDKDDGRGRRSDSPEGSCGGGGTTGVNDGWRLEASESDSDMDMGKEDIDGLSEDGGREDVLDWAGSVSVSYDISVSRVGERIGEETGKIKPSVPLCE
jgi:hypothetical protein